MARRQNDSRTSRWVYLILMLVGFVSCSVVYMVMSSAFRPSTISSVSDLDSSSSEGGSKLKPNSGLEDGQCCRGVDNLELWGPVAKWGTDFKVNSAKECCQACKEMCNGRDESCLCNSWVFCGNKESCGSKYRECWLKKQKDHLAPEIHAEGEKVMWTSGLMYRKGAGIVGLETEYGMLHIELFPEVAPHSVRYILDLLELRHCAGCHFYRAEGRGTSWDSKGNHIKDASFGPPYALIQGTLEAQGIPSKTLPLEDCPAIKRGSIALIGSGPEFFISLANHYEWKNAYTVFGSVLPEDMEKVEKIAQLATKPDVWRGVNVSVLEKPASLRWRRV